MSFTIRGMECWRFQIVLDGQHVILEGFHGNARVSTELMPWESRIERAYELAAQAAT
jgi:hypothetical protein